MNGNLTYVMAASLNSDVAFHYQQMGTVLNTYYVYFQGAQDKKKAKLYGKMGKQIQQVYALWLWYIHYRY